MSAVVREHASELADSVYFVQRRFGKRCFIAGIESEVSPDVLDPYLRWVEDVASICLSPYARLDPMFHEARASGDLHPCLFHELDHEQLKETMAAHGPALWEGDAEAASTLISGLIEVGRTVELCDEDGRYAERWWDYIRDL